MRYCKCEEHCGNCSPLTITVSGKQCVYRYGSKKQRVLGLAQLRYIYKNMDIKPEYVCMYKKG